MLPTNLKHLTNAKEAESFVSETDNVMICCGRMGPMCVPVYAAMEQLEKEYPQVAFRDLAFDSPEGTFIRDLPETASFMGLPFTVYFKNGKVVEATSGIQNKTQIESILKREFPAE